MAYQESADDHPTHHHVNYFVIFIALCICTGLSVVFDLLTINPWVVAVLVLAVAVAKAQYVMRYFMHLKFEGAWKYVLLLPTAILACGLPLALAPDIGLHYYTPEVPQVRAAAAAGLLDTPLLEDEFEEGANHGAGTHGAAGHAGGGHGGEGH